MAQTIGTFADSENRFIERDIDAEHEDRSLLERAVRGDFVSRPIPETYDDSLDERRVFEEILERCAETREVDEYVAGSETYQQWKPHRVLYVSYAKEEIGSRGVTSLHPATTEPEEFDPFDPRWNYYGEERV